MVDFGCRTARSGAMTSVIGTLIVAETATVHVLLMLFSPVLAYLFSASSLSLLVWLVLDFRALGTQPALSIAGATLRVTIGRRVRGEVPLATVAGAIRPSWQELSGSAPRFLNGTKPTTPNVLLVFSPPQELLLFGAVRRPVTRLALHVDDPDRCIASLLAGRPGLVAMAPDQRVGVPNGSPVPV